jgi:hypothetical protein
MTIGTHDTTVRTKAGRDNPSVPFFANYRRSMAELVASHTLHGRTSIAMAVATEVHAGGDLLLQHIARLHGSVAFGTMEPRLDVRGVAKEYKVRNTIDRHPGNSLTLLSGDAEFRHFGAVRLDRPVASQAEVRGRDSRVVALGDPGVAEVARQAYSPGMDAVAEGHGLRRY